MKRGMVIVLLVACSNGAHKIDKPPPVPGDAAGGSAVEMKPDANDSVFVKGAALTPVDPLITWLDSQKRGDEARLLRVPVVLAKTPSGSFTMRGATLGPALVIHINDSALGIGLTDRARKCKDASGCAFAVEAYWRGKQDGNYQLDVMKVGDPLSAEALAAFTHAEVQGESHN